MTERPTERLYKALGPDRMPCHGGVGQWPEPGDWREVSGELIPCKNGIHVATLAQLLNWLEPEIWTVEVDGERIDHDDKLVVRRARLIEQTRWDERIARLFAADCAERVLPLFERRHPGDDRPRRAIETARAYANGAASADELDAADAWAAAGAAADAAADAWAAARAAADAAVWAAARAAERAWQAQRLGWYLHGEEGR